MYSSNHTYTLGSIMAYHGVAADEVVRGGRRHGPDGARGHARRVAPLEPRVDVALYRRGLFLEGAELEVDEVGDEVVLDRRDVRCFGVLQ